MIAAEVRVGAWVIALLGTAHAATLVTCGSAPSEGCYPTIRDAVGAAAPGDTIELETGLYHEAVTIEKDLTLLGRSGHLLIGPFDPAIVSMIRVKGATVTFDGIAATAAAVRVIEATGGATIVLKDVSLASYGAVDHGGVLLASDSVVRFEGYVDSVIGPGRAVRGGLMFLTDTELDTTAVVNGTTFAEGVALQDGGAILAIDTDGLRETLQLDEASFRDNRAATDGGAVAAYGVDVLVTGNATFTGNEAAGNGGGIYGADARIEVEEAGFEANGALTGGAIASLDETAQPIVVRDAWFTGNRAGSGGAIGGGSTDLQVEDSFFSANETSAIDWTSDTTLRIVRTRFCDNPGGAIYAYVGTASIRNSEFYRNSATASRYNGGGGVVEAFGSERVEIHHNNFLENDGVVASALSVNALPESEVQIADNLLAWNVAETGEALDIGVGAWAIAIPPVVVGARIDHNLFFANGGDGPISTGTTSAGLEADPQLPHWDVDAACDMFASEWDHPAWPSWYSPARDGGSVGRDPDGTTADIGVFGGPEADAWSFEDLDGDDYPHIYDCLENPDPVAGSGRVHPKAIDAPYDGEDTNCDWRSDYDADHDGHDAAAYGGDDCDDANSTLHPGAVDIPYNGVDENCDDLQDDDLDGDGWDHPADCDDADSTIYPGAPDAVADRDRDCDGLIDLPVPLRPRGCAVGGGSGPWALLALLMGLRRRR